jgi:hypothetical protein
VVLSAGKTGAGQIVRRFTRAANAAACLRLSASARQAGPAAQEDTGLYLATGLEFVQFWQDNAQYDCLDDHFSAKQDHFFPQP